MSASSLPILVTQEQYEDLLFMQEMEQERRVYDWEAPFPMDLRTQAELAENEQRIVREGIARFSAFITSDPLIQMTHSPF